MTILLLGGSGYIGRAFRSELEQRNWQHVSLTRAAVDYTRFRALLNLLRDLKPNFVINCAGFTGKPNVDACETAKDETILGNIVLPETIANACEVENIALGHVSSGCIYSGAKLNIPGQPQRIAKDLMAADVRRLWEADPFVLEGFSEHDLPNFHFGDPPCSFYSGTKAVSETVLSRHEKVYQWRMRIPFDEIDDPRNYLSKIQRYTRVYQNVNSISHRGDFAKACLDLWERRAAFGIYNVTNPGWITTKQIAERLKTQLGLDREFEYFLDDSEFYQHAIAPRSNTILETRKLLDAGVTIRPVEEAIESAINGWQAAIN